MHDTTKNNEVIAAKYDLANTTGNINSTQLESM